jgi:multisubunit Na+/H+ antiporter MnhC subunit
VAAAAIIAAIVIAIAIAAAAAAIAEEMSRLKQKMEIRTMDIEIKKEFKTG